MYMQRRRNATAVRLAGEGRLKKREEKRSVAASLGEDRGGKREGGVVASFPMGSSGMG
jgi:hypothetical protein